MVRWAEARPHSDMFGSHLLVWVRACSPLDAVVAAAYALRMHFRRSAVAVSLCLACSAGGEGGNEEAGAGGLSAGSGGTPGAGGSPVGAAAAGGNGGVAGALGGSGGQVGAGAGAATGSGGSDLAGASGAAGASMGTGGTDVQPPGDLLLRDDFESAAPLGAPNAALWTRRLGFGGADDPSTIAIDDTNAHSGDQSVRIVGTSSIREIVANVAVSRLFVRAWMQLSPSPVPSGTPVVIGVGGDQNADIRMRLWAGRLATLNTGNGDGVAPNTATSGNCPTCVAVPSEWFCTEMFVDHAAQNATIWINGAEAASVTGNAGWHVGSVWPQFPTPTNVRLGFWGLEGAAATIWIDDVAIAEERIGCE